MPPRIKKQRNDLPLTTDQMQQLCHVAGIQRVSKNIAVKAMEVFDTLLIKLLKRSIALAIDIERTRGGKTATLTPKLIQMAIKAETGHLVLYTPESIADVEYEDETISGEEQDTDDEDFDNFVDSDEVEEIY